MDGARLAEQVWHFGPQQWGNETRDSAIPVSRITNSAATCFCCSFVEFVLCITGKQTF
jgi:hypothetical protein